MLMAFYSRFLPDFFAAAQRFRIASAIRLRTGADIIRVLRVRLATGLLLLPGGRPRLSLRRWHPLELGSPRRAYPSPPEAVELSRLGSWRNLNTGIHERDGYRPRRRRTFLNLTSR
jgi:hypothetical protein